MGLDGTFSAGYGSDVISPIVKIAELAGSTGSASVTGTSGDSDWDGDIIYIGGGGTVVNPDGGLKAKGHPIGATGVSMSYEIVRQLRGECGERQVPNADVGLTHNVGGIGQYTFVNVYRRD